MMSLIVQPKYNEAVMLCDNSSYINGMESSVSSKVLNTIIHWITLPIAQEQSPSETYVKNM